MTTCPTIFLAANHTRVWQLRADGYPMGWMMSPGGWRHPERDGLAPMVFASDNGLYHAPDELPKGMKAFPAFYDMLAKIAAGGWSPAFVVVPDEPYCAAGTRALFPKHARHVRDELPSVRLAMAVQDGMTEADLDLFPDSNAAIFVAGSTDWKLSTMERWAQVGYERGLWVHIARVNTRRRLRRIIDIAVTPQRRVDSVDGAGLWRGDRNQLKGVLDTLVEGHLFARGAA